MTYTFQNALVTGGAGFIGSHLTETLVEAGCKVVVLDNLVSGNLNNLKAVQDKITFIKGDIQDEKILTQAMTDCEVVFHLAAVVSVTQTVKQPVFSASVNEMGAIKVLECARNNRVQRIVLSSSCAVYGDDPQLPKEETMAAKPLSPYALQKLINEYYAELYCRLYKTPTVCLRYFNVYGPRQDPSSPYSGVISIFMTKAVADQEPVIYGNGKQTRDFIYVQDVVDANLSAAQYPEAAGQVFNIGSSRDVDINTLWQMIANMAGSARVPTYVDSRPGDIKYSVADIQKAREILSFTPVVAFDEGLRNTFKWYQKQ